MGDSRPGRRVRSLMNRHWSDQIVVGADEDVFLDDRVVLGACESVVVTGDRSRSDIDVLGNCSVADVRKMWNLAPRSQG